MMNEQENPIFYKELGKKKKACLKVSARPVSAHMTLGCNLLMQMPKKNSAYKKVFVKCLV